MKIKLSTTIMIGLRLIMVLFLVTLVLAFFGVNVYAEEQFIQSVSIESFSEAVIANYEANSVAEVGLWRLDADTSNGFTSGLLTISGFGVAPRLYEGGYNTGYNTVGGSSGFVATFAGACDDPDPTTNCAPLNKVGIFNIWTGSCDNDPSGSGCVFIYIPNDLPTGTYMLFNYAFYYDNTSDNRLTSPNAQNLDLPLPEVFGLTPYMYREQGGTRISLIDSSGGAGATGQVEGIYYVSAEAEINYLLGDITDTIGVLSASKPVGNWFWELRPVNRIGVIGGFDYTPANSGDLNNKNVSRIYGLNLSLFDSSLAIQNLTFVNSSGETVSGTDLIVDSCGVELFSGVSSTDTDCFVDMILLGPTSYPYQNVTRIYIPVQDTYIERFNPTMNFNDFPTLKVGDLRDYRLRYNDATGNWSYDYSLAYNLYTTFIDFGLDVDSLENIREAYVLLDLIAIQNGSTFNNLLYEYKIENVNVSFFGAVYTLPLKYHLLNYDNIRWRDSFINDVIGFADDNLTIENVTYEVRLNVTQQLLASLRYNIINPQIIVSAYSNLTGTDENEFRFVFASSEYARTTQLVNPPRLVVDYYNIDELDLDPDDENIIVWGTLYDIHDYRDNGSFNESTIQGAKINVEGDVVYSNEYGIFMFRLKKSTEYILSITKDGYAVKTLVVYTTNDSIMGLGDISLFRGLGFIEGYTTNLYGDTYYIKRDGERINIPGVTVCYTNSTDFYSCVESDDYGFYLFANISIDTVRVVAIKEGFKTYNKTIQLYDTNNVQGIYLKLGISVDTDETLLTFFIQDLEKNPLSGVKITVANLDKYTNKEGIIEFVVTRGYSYKYFIELEGYNSISGTFSANKQFITLEIDMEVFSEPVGINWPQRIEQGLINTGFSKLAIGFIIVLGSIFLGLSFVRDNSSDKGVVIVCGSIGALGAYKLNFLPIGLVLISIVIITIGFAGKYRGIITGKKTEEEEE